MLSLFHGSHLRRPTAAISEALASDGLPSGLELAAVLVVLQRGAYAGRRVEYFRAFDPVCVVARGLEVRHFADLDAYPDLVLGSGHVEADGVVVLSRRERSQPSPTPIRSQADRSAHADDQHVVFPNGTR